MCSNACWQELYVKNRLWSHLLKLLGYYTFHNWVADRYNAFAFYALLLFLNQKSQECFQELDVIQEQIGM